MEFETINKETPEMKQLISGIRNLTKRVRTTAQTHRPLFDGELYLTTVSPILIGYYKRTILTEACIGNGAGLFFTAGYNIHLGLYAKVLIFFVSLTISSYICR